MANIRLVIVVVFSLGFLEMRLRADSIDAHLRQEILAGWAELERIDNSRTAIDTTWTSHETGGARAGTSSGFGNYRRNGQCWRTSGQRGQGPIEEFVVNSRYLFSVARESNAQPWAMRFVQVDLGSPNAKQLQDLWSSAKIFAPNSAVLLTAGQHPKPSSLADDLDFKMTRVDRLPDGLIKLHFQHQFAVGEFDCDPAANYVIRRGHSREKDSRREYIMTFERHFGPTGPDGRANVERLVFEFVFDAPSKRITEHSYSYPDVRKTGELDEERFRLTAYGLPEPEGIVWEKPRRWLPYWLAGAGAFIILLTTWVIRRARRTQAKEKQA